MRSVYPKPLDEQLRGMLTSVVYIPRKMHYDEKLRQYKRYYQLPQELYFKVLEVYHTNDVEYYTIRYQENFTGIMPYPVDKDTYEMMIDKNDIANLDNIVNSEESYTGAEIKYWFYSHQIDLQSDKYKDFWFYLSNQSKSEISDNKSYFCKALMDEEGNYYKCRFPLDKTKMKRRERK